MPNFYCRFIAAFKMSHGKDRGKEGPYDIVSNLSKKNIILELVKGIIKVKKAVARLDCSRRTVERNRRRFFEPGPEALLDQRGRNWRSLSAEKEERIVKYKLEGRR